MYRYLFLIFFVCLVPQFLFAAGEDSSSAEPGYQLEDFELSDLEKQKIEGSHLKRNNAKLRFQNKNSRVLFIHQLDSDGSEELEDLLLVLRENGYIGNLNYLYKNDQEKLDEQDYLDLQVRLILKQYLPEIFYQYIKFRKNDIDISTAMYYSGVSPDVVYDLVSKYGQEFVQKNSVKLNQYNEIIQAPALYINEKIVQKHELEDIVDALDYQSYQTTENIDLKLFVSYGADLEYLPITIDQNNVVRLTRAESLKVADQLDIREMPFAFAKSDKVDDSILYDNGFVKKDEYFTIEGIGPLKFYKQRRISPARIDVFISGNDENSIKMLNSIKSLRNKADIIIHPVVNQKDLEKVQVPEKISSSGAAEQVRENLRLICLYKRSKDDFWNYIEQKNNDPEKNWEDIYSSIGVDVDQITNCAYSEEGERYIKEGLFLVNDLNIVKTPQILWQNQYLAGSFEHLEQVESFSDLQKATEGTK